MKVSCAVLLVIIGVAAAGRPQLSIKLKDGNFADLGCLDPSISWEASRKTGEIDFEGGINIVPQATNDFASLPKSVWGKASASILGWGVSARAAVGSANSSSADIEIEANEDQSDVSFKMFGSLTDLSFSASKIEATKTMHADGANISVTPRYDLDTEEGDLVMSYSKDDVKLEVMSSKQDHAVSYSQQLDDENRLGGSMTKSGSVSLEWERALAGDKSVTAILKPNESIDVEWNDDPWKVNMNIAIDGASIVGPTVSITRDLTF
mmetsp:Transcript_16371/g.24001  ORF Transcript_16371/g.24001 Transcript_16371/m.24001 type:complete len:265 (+) Transcript_16371:66-860(+)|eukprot:CAMPEP_0195521490 /NCGR_PEP_ID=MMETSP0794_2-20130614/18797_1 /TAXON_ID=515487 /ORGANISM="Stephanopyxis turris, Strain CCMP 815" /LENGTH=264 /DNA_ID=CAMNT_0040651061 /DNA_START=65 /DNA_END=859 /DNA_ORIENTATION=+